MILNERFSLIVVLILVLLVNCLSLVKCRPFFDGQHKYSLYECDTNDGCNSFVNQEKFEIKLTSKELCDFCDILLPIVRTLIDKNQTEHFHDIATYFCKELKIADEIVCNLGVKSYELSALSVARDSSLSSAEACALAFGCKPVTNPIVFWNVTLPDVPKPPVKPIRPPKSGSPITRILQLSDIHIDFEYQPGSLAECGQPLCCRNSSTLKSSSSDISHNDKSEEAAAGYWGDYRNCDIPLWTVENMFEHISQNEEFDFIYWTGDLPPHNVWNQTRNDQLNALEKLTELFNKYFPNKLIFPTLGNHEAQPCNLYPTPGIKEDNIDWLYSALAKEWTKIGLPNYLSTNISNGAFYTVKLFNNLRVISLNTNYCPRENFWLLINSTDPLDQLKWLAETLQESENNGEIVHIIGHIHPSLCLDSWSSNYYRIVNRYESTIAGQFFGHTHRDELRITYDLNNITRPINVAYLAPSITTSTFLNPGYRIYIADGYYNDSTWQILDHSTRFLNLTEANQFGVPKWRTEYSAKDAFNLENLYPQDWNDLIEKMNNDPFGPLANKFFRYYSKSSDLYPECDLTCRKILLCDFKQARSDKFIPC